MSCSLPYVAFPMGGLPRFDSYHPDGSCSYIFGIGNDHRGRFYRSIYLVLNDCPIIQNCNNRGLYFSKCVNQVHFLMTVMK